MFARWRGPRGGTGAAVREGVNLATETSVELDLQSSTRHVRFRLRSVFVPPPAELLQLLYGEQLLQGVVVGRSRNQRDGDQVVIKLDGLDALLVVPETALQQG